MIESLLAKGKKIKKGNDQKIKKNSSVLPSITVRNLIKTNKKIRVLEKQKEKELQEELQKKKIKGKRVKVLKDW